MKPPPGPDLARAQHWMQAFILAEGSDEAALASSTAEAEIPKKQALAMVKPSAALTSLERAGIYRRMYSARLTEALAIDYPGVRAYLGAAGFDDLAGRYIAAHPSRSYTLNRLGDHFPAFLDDPFARDLAQLELALTEVFDAEETPALTEADIANVPAQAWETARLRTVAAFRLLRFDYPVSAYLSAVDGESAFPDIGPEPNWVAAYRNGYRVGRLDLNRAGYALLGDLAAGKPVGEAAERSGAAEEQIFAWFREWTGCGLFQAILVE